MKKIIVLLMGLVLAAAAEEENELNRLSMSVDDDGGAAFSTPVNWNQHYFSSVSYLKTQLQQHESVQGSSGEKVEKVSGADATFVSVNLLSYQTTMENGAVYAVGVGGGVATYDFDQVGYAYASSTNYFAAYTTGTSRLYQFGAYADFAQTRLLDMFSYRIAMAFYPVTYHDYSEIRTSVPTPTYDLTLEEKKWQSPLQFNLAFVMLLEPVSYVSLLIEGTLNYNTLERGYIDYAPGRTDYVVGSTEYKFTTLGTGAKLLFPVLAYGGISPSVGVQYTKSITDYSYSLGGSVKVEMSQTAFTVGFDKPF